MILPMWKEKISLTRSEEIVNNVVMLTLQSTQEGMWALISALIVYRAPALSFYLGTVGVLLIKLLERVVSAVRLRKRIARQVQAANKSSSGRDIDELKSSLTFAEKSRKLFVAPAPAAPIDAAESRAVAFAQNTFVRPVVIRAHSTEIDPDQHVTGRSHTILGRTFTNVFRKVSVEEKPTEAETKHGPDKMAGGDYGNDTSVAIDAPSPLSLNTSDTAYKSHTTIRISVASTTSTSTAFQTSDSLRPEPEPEEQFVPMATQAYQAYLRLGTISADWSAHLVSVAAAYLFLSISPLSTFFACNGVIEISEVLPRYIFTWLQMAVFELAGFVVDVKVGGLDYERGLSEFWEWGFTGKSMYYVTCNMAGVLGAMVLAEAGPFMLGLKTDESCFLKGRRTGAGD
ncbi:hypothetical protein HK101_009413 [Irineochytrium annulatum]|nr:hypothetical protein HK101_009413 [Irineochytrium annulatum]